MTPGGGLAVTEARRRHFALLEAEWDGLAATPHRLEPATCANRCPVAAEPLFVKRGSTFVRCPDCGLIFLTPQLTEAALADHFAHSEAWAVWAERVLPDPDQQAFDRRKYADALDVVGSLSATPGHVLDVGANAGVFLAEARARGWRVAGIEPGKAACRVAAAMNGVELWPGTFPDFAAEPESFDLVTFWASLEYMKHPAPMVDKALELLKPGGLLLVFVSGNGHSLVMRMLRAACVGFVFNRPWTFSPSSLDRLVLRPGVALAERHSVVPSLDVVQRWLDYRDPYGDAAPTLLAPGDLAGLERAVAERHMGYKVQSIYRKEARR